jgi:hypothetical protein
LRLQCPPQPIPSTWAATAAGGVCTGHLLATLNVACHDFCSFSLNPQHCYRRLVCPRQFYLRLGVTHCRSFSILHCLVLLHPCPDSGKAPLHMHVLAILTSPKLRLSRRTLSFNSTHLAFDEISSLSAITALPPSCHSSKTSADDQERVFVPPILPPTPIVP